MVAGRLPLALRVPLITAALMVLVGLVASQQVLGALGRVQDARLRELAQMHVEGLSVALGPYVLRRDVWEVYDTLDRASREGERMVLTAVADDSGRVLAATDPRRAPVDTPIDALIEGAEPPQNLSAMGAARHVRLVAPLVYQGRDVGQIASELDVSDLVAERRRAWRLLLAGNALATGALAFLGYVAVRRMLRPMATVAEHMTQSPDTPEPIPEAELPADDGEVARLARAYNQMAGAVLAKAEAERRLAERERFVSLGRLSSSLAHEINNPLGGLLNATDTIRTYADRPEVVRRSAELLDRGLRHMRDVVRATLDQNRLDRGGAALSREDFEDLRLLIEPEVARQGQRLDWSVDDDGLADFAAGPVRQVVLNLLLNASTAAGRGGRVSLAVMGSAEDLAISVSDDGPGLSETARRRLMTSEPTQPGSGVGLRLVRDVIGALAGTVGIERIDGTTTITVRMPRPALTVAAQ
jgi:signal transduction histidine kinase